MERKTNYWILKDSELVDELDKRGIELPAYNRKDAVAAIKRDDMKKSGITEIYTEDYTDDEGEIKALGLDELKKDVPKLEKILTVKVDFFG